MNPFSVMLKMLGLLATGAEAVASLPDGTVLSSLKGGGPCWQSEAELVACGNPPLGVQDPVIRTIVMPLIRANRLLAEEENKRRFTQAREAVARCEAADWRKLCTEWIDEVEKEHNGG